MFKNNREQKERKEQEQAMAVATHVITPKTTFPPGISGGDDGSASLRHSLGSNNSLFRSADEDGLQSSPVGGVGRSNLMRAGSINASMRVGSVSSPRRVSGNAHPDLRPVARINSFFSDDPADGPLSPVSPVSPPIAAINALRKELEKEPSVDSLTGRARSTKGGFFGAMFPRGQGSSSSQRPRQGSNTSIVAFGDSMPSSRHRVGSDCSEDGGDSPESRVVLAVARPGAGRAGSVTTPKAVAVSRWEAELKQMLCSNERTQAMTLAGPREGLVWCCLQRQKGIMGRAATFKLHLENGDEFLLAAKTRKKTKKSSYSISLDAKDLDHKSANCLAKVKANYMGSSYMAWRRGGDASFNKGFGRQDLAILYKAQPLASSNGPRSMTLALPNPDKGFRPFGPADGPEGLQLYLEQGLKQELSQSDDRVSFLATMAPAYDDKLKAYTLDFQGRVKEGSVKNFMLAHYDHNTAKLGWEPVMRFGKIKADMYALDFKFPLSVCQALSIALSSIDVKLCYAF